MTLHVLEPGTIADLLGRELRDERELSLTSAPVLIFTDKSVDHTRYSVLIDTSLDRRRLMDLLFTVAPYKAHGPDRFPRVLDNWALFERAQTSSASESLLLQHAGRLGFSWQEFARHRQAFVEVLADPSGEQRVSPLIAWSRGADGRRRWEFDIQDEDLRRIEAVRPAVSQERLGTLVGLVTIPYFLPEQSKNWHAWQPLTKGGKSNYVGPASVPVLALMHRRALLNSTLIQRAEDYVAVQTV